MPTLPNGSQNGNVDYYEDGTPHPYRGHYVILWGCIILLFYLLVGVGVAIWFIFK